MNDRIKEMIEEIEAIKVKLAEENRVLFLPYQTCKKDRL